MKIFIGLSWISILITLSNLFNFYKNKLLIYLMFITLIINIALGLNIKINFMYTYVYLSSLMLTLLLYYLLIKSNSNLNNNICSIKIKYININLVCIFIIYICQYFLLNVYNYNLFFTNLTTFINIYLICHLFRKFAIFKYNKKYIFDSIILFSFFNSILAFLQFIFNKTFLLFDSKNINYKSIIEVKRVVGFIGTNNGAGNLGAILFPILLYDYIKNKRKITLLAIILNIIFTVLTLTRIGYLSIIIESLIFLCLTFKKFNYKNQLKIIILSLSIIIISIILLKFNINNIYYILFQGRGGTQDSRFIQFTYVINEWIKHPVLGVGSGQYIYYIYNNYGMHDLVIHSQYLNILFEQGALSFISFLIFNTYLYINLIKNSIYDNWFIHALFWGNLIVINFNPNQYYQLNIYLYYFAIFGLTYASNSKKLKNKIGD